MTDLTGNKTDRDLMRLVGERLRIVRKGQKLKILDVARRAGLHRSTVSKAESGDNPTLLTLIRMLRVYGRTAEFDGFLREAPLSPMELLRRPAPGG